jgi:hypothetical protein
MRIASARNPGLMPYADRLCGKLGSFCTIGPLVLQGSGAGGRVSTRRSLIPETRSLGKLGSFRTFDPTKLGSFRTIRLALDTSNLRLLLKLGSFRIFCASRRCPSRAKLASFRTFDPQQIGFVLHDQQVRPDSRNRLPQQKLVSLCLIQKLGSFRTIAPQRGLPTPAARAHSWALGRNWVRFAQWDVPGGRLGANWVCFSRLPTARVPQAWPILCREPPTDHCELVRLPSTDYRLPATASWPSRCLSDSIILP